MSRNLIITPTGNSSLFKNWISGKTNFDIALLCYEDIDFDLDQFTPHHYRYNGEKWHIIKKFIVENINFILSYDYFWFPDDDIDTDTDSINKLFRIHSDYNLSISQPSIIGPQSFNITKKHENCFLRYTNFVEVMCPMMDKQSLLLVFDSFDKSKSGWGLDLLWQKILQYPQNSAIIDEVSVTHTIPVGQNYYNGRFKTSPNLELKRIMKKWGLTLDLKEYNRIVKD